MSSTGMASPSSKRKSLQEDGPDGNAGKRVRFNASVDGANTQRGQAGSSDGSSGLRRKIPVDDESPGFGVEDPFSGRGSRKGAIRTLDDSDDEEYDMAIKEKYDAEVLDPNNFATAGHQRQRQRIDALDDTTDGNDKGKGKAMPPPVSNSTSAAGMGLKAWDFKREHEEHIDVADVEERDRDVKLDPFNIEQELDEGEFDETGNYVRKVDPDRDQDNWLDGISKNDMQKARMAFEKKQAEAEAQSANGKLPAKEVVRRMQQLMEPKESVLKALQRMGQFTKRQRTQKKPRKKKATDEAPADSTSQLSPEQIKAYRQRIEQLTELADTLLSQYGHTNAYQETVESLQRFL